MKYGTMKIVAITTIRWLYVFHQHKRNSMILTRGKFLTNEEKTKLCKKKGNFLVLWQFLTVLRILSVSFFFYKWRDKCPCEIHVYDS